VLPNLSHSLLLGSDFLKYYSAQVDFTSNSISFKENLVTLNLHKRCASETVLKLAKTVTIPPRTEALLPVIIPPQYINRICLVKPLTNCQKCTLPVARIVMTQSTTSHNICHLLQTQMSIQINA